MATLPVATLLTVLDSVAKGVEVFEAAVGEAGDAGTVAKGAANNVATLEAVADSDVQADLAAVFAGRAAQVRASVLARTLGGAALQRALDRHYGAGPGSLNAFLASEDARVHPALRRIGFQIDAANAFYPSVLTPMATFVLTGPGAGTFTAGASIDTAAYGKAALQVKTTVLIGAAAVSVTLTLQRADGGSDTRVVAIPGDTPADTLFAVGGASDRYVGCTGISVSGGTSGDALVVQSQVERAVAL